MYKLLIIDDEEPICSSLAFALDSEYEVYSALNEEAAFELFAAQEFDLVLLDLRLGKTDGLEVLTKIKEIRPTAMVIIMTAYGSIQSSVTAMKKGAFYYITKPINMEELRVLLNNATNYIKLSSRVEHYAGKIFREYEQTGIIGRSKAVHNVFNLIEKVRDMVTNVMITGETGTGKELVARAIHFTGIRKNEPFEVINCAAIPPNLLESELFGHERGAFTGALQRKRGIFELADKGTLFLDEICEMDINLQSKLLRAVQQKEIIPVGSTICKQVDVRIICATNRNFAKEIAAGRFREDLFYRLNVINIHLTPLRERSEDIPLLVDYFIAKYNRKMGKAIAGISQQAMEVLCRYSFKGNVRELENIVERMLVLSDGEYLEIQDLPTEVCLGQSVKLSNSQVLIPVYVGESMDVIEQKVILHTLKSLKGNRRETAKMLDISERSLRYKLKEYSVEPEKNAEPAKNAALNT
ncbi:MULTISPECIES: sigma-54 dependent transcriptional regulator [Sporomusa]|uniref:sigma-54-dependent transcriptional regulator n=1 Tax=Sporomusa TaxID=2375 RepID=UPI001668AE45|nr:MULTISPECIES: sigma-54 dependent transcriptional regulator [Sporomusa]MCM0758383.1 sigma-54 dependent transcriptional regulator [Sporomusa sphaeroides DSM 2875]HML34882.1 sigma-54 dependent transcriptional regulator [Sporomusa sphaeroides]